MLDNRIFCPLLSIPLNVLVEAELGLVLRLTNSIPFPLLCSTESLKVLQRLNKGNFSFLIALGESNT